MFNLNLYHFSENIKKTHPNVKIINNRNTGYREQVTK